MLRSITVALAVGSLLVGTLASGASATPRRSAVGLDIGFFDGVMDPWTSPADLVECAEADGAQLDFAWGDGAPEGCPLDFFSAYAAGSIVAPTSGTVDFCSSTDDGFLLQIGATRVIDDWVGHGPEICNATGSIRMVKGKRYPLRIWYFDVGSAATLHLYWDYPGHGGWSSIPLESLAAR